MTSGDDVTSSAPVSIKRSIINILDRPGGRAVLASLANAYARLVSGADVRTLHHMDLWMHSANGYTIPDGDSFNFFSNSPDQWANEVDQWFLNAKRYWYKVYCPHPGDVIVDVGAGRGEDTLPFSKAVGPSGRVVAIEAQPSSFELLRMTCNLNGLHNVIAVNAAASDAEGFMYVQKSDQGWRCDTALHAEQARDRSTPIRCTTIDEICSELRIDKINFLKMNIEGGERLALKGSVAVGRKADAVCICCHDFRADAGEGTEFRTREFAEQWLRDNGFQITRFPAQEVWLRDHIYGSRRRGQ